MSIFASQTAVTMLMAFDAPHTITIRKLTGREVDQAQEAHADGVTAGRARLWATKFRRILEGSLTDKAEIQSAIADPLTGYDRFSVVRAGLMAWSYPQPLKKPVPRLNGEWVDPIEDLDDETVDFIATEILRLTKPALFYAAQEDAEAAQKKTHAAPSVA